MGKKDQRQEDSGVKTRKRQKTAQPRQYRVLLHNDDYTPMEFVVAVLQQVFHRDEVEATHIMLTVHNDGIGLAGVYAHAIAETKVHQVLDSAAHHEFPLQCSMEPE